MTNIRNVRTFGHLEGQMEVWTIKVAEYRLTNLIDPRDDSLMESHATDVISCSSAITSLRKEHDGIHTNLVFTWNLINSQVL